MREYTVKGIKRFVYESEDELPAGFTFIENWKEGQVGDWVKADDDCYIEILRRKSMRPHRKNIRHAREYVGTCTGTYMINPSSIMDTVKKHNIYSFGGSKTSSKALFDRKHLNSNEELFALYIAQGMPPVDAYTKVYETNNRKYAEGKVKLLLKTERIKKAVKEEIKPILTELGIDEEFILKGIRNVALTARQDGEKLKALIKLSDIMEIEDKGTKQSGVAMIGFQGFQGNTLEEAVKVTEEITE